MKKSVQITGLLLALPFLLFTCCKKEEDVPPVHVEQLWACHHEMTWDSLSTRNALLGEWEWEFISCYWSPENANGDEFKGLVIHFKSDDTLIVTENGQITQVSSWKVVDGDGDLFELEVNPYVGQLYGRILFCDQKVEFNDSYIDGCDNYFVKK